MTTYYIRALLPLLDSDKAVFAAHHAETTSGNQLAVMVNGAQTECLIKCNCDHAIDEILPEGFVPLEVLTSAEDARALLNSIEWAATDNV